MDHKSLAEKGVENFNNTLIYEESLEINGLVDIGNRGEYSTI